MRVEVAEKQALKDAADLAGLGLSAWIRQRLRRVAREELEEAGLPVAFLDSGRRKKSQEGPAKQS